MEREAAGTRVKMGSSSSSSCGLTVSCCLPHNSRLCWIAGAAWRAPLRQQRTVMQQQGNDNNGSPSPALTSPQGWAAA